MVKQPGFNGPDLFIFASSCAQPAIEYRLRLSLFKCSRSTFQVPVLILAKRYSNIVTLPTPAMSRRVGNLDQFHPEVLRIIELRQLHAVARTVQRMPAFLIEVEDAAAFLVQERFLSSMFVSSMLMINVCSSVRVLNTNTRVFVF